MPSEIYDYEERLQRYKRIIRGLRDGGLALRFLDHMAALGLSVARVSKYASHLPALLRVIDFDLRKATRSDVERVVAWINSQPYREWTKHDKKLALRKLIQYAKYGRCDRDTPIPPEVSWISLTVKGKDSRVTPESLLTHEEFGRIVKAAENPRDRALVYVLFEGAFRPGEILSMNVGSVEFRDNYCLVVARGKKGIKRIPLVVSYQPLLEWLEKHPCRDNPEAPLWPSLSRNYRGKRLSYRHFRLIIKRLAKRAGIKKPVWPYLFRHTTLTALARVFTEAKLEQYAGWVHGSKMASRYVHFSARDLEDAVLELHGLEEPSKNSGIIRVLVCPRCRRKNPFGAVRCSFCGFILDRELAIRLEQERVEEAESLLERVKRLESLVRSLLQGGSATPQAPQGFPGEHGAQRVYAPWTPQISPSQEGGNGRL